jgi:hypothetical protein
MFGPVLHIICQPAKIQNHQNPASAASVATGCNRNWDKDMPAALAAREVQVLATPRRNVALCLKSQNHKISDISVDPRVILFPQLFPQLFRATVQAS